MVAEYGGLQSTDEGGVKYLLADWQGSTRAIASNTGFVQTRLDYSAYGEEIASGIGQRTAAQGFGSVNSLRQKYGLTERDEATGLDHTWFRKNENRAGRWTGADPYNGSMSISDPQSFNRYAYVANQPTNFIDPSGLNAASGGFSWSCWVTWRSDGDGSNFHITSVTCWTVDDGRGGSGRQDVQLSNGGVINSKVNNDRKHEKAFKNCVSDASTGISFAARNYNISVNGIRSRTDNQKEQLLATYLFVAAIAFATSNLPLLLIAIAAFIAGNQLANSNEQSFIADQTGLFHNNINKIIVDCASKNGISFG